MKTLVISKHDVPELLALPELIKGTKEAYIKHAHGKTAPPQRISTAVANTSIVVNLPGHLAESDYFTVKINTKSPSNHQLGLPFLMGTILLLNTHTGHVCAILDSGLITAMRTGAAGAVAVSELANPNANQIGLIGAGFQAEWQIRALQSVNRIEAVFIYDVVPEKATQLANLLKAEHKLPCKVVTDLKRLIDQSEILITTTPSTEPILFYNMLHSGQHINAFGADQPGKIELSADIINQCSMYVDDLDIALTHGSLNVVYKAMQLKNPAVHAIGHVLENKLIGRKTPEDITVFGNTGLAFQDLVACKIIYEKALQVGKGTWIELNASA